MTPTICVMQVVIGARNEVYMVMEYVEHDLKYVLELQHKKKAPQFSIGQVSQTVLSTQHGMLNHNYTYA